MNKEFRYGGAHISSLCSRAGVIYTAGPYHTAYLVRSFHCYCYCLTFLTRLYSEAFIVSVKEYLELEAGRNKKNGLAKDYKVVNGLLCRAVDGGHRPVLPKGARWHILKTYHDNSGHLGAAKCLEAIQAKYWFPKMRRSVEKYVASCIGCQFTKKPTGKATRTTASDTKGFFSFSHDARGSSGTILQEQWQNLYLCYY